MSSRGEGSFYYGYLNHNNNGQKYWATFQGEPRFAIRATIRIDGDFSIVTLECYSLGKAMEGLFNEGLGQPVLGWQCYNCSKYQKGFSGPLAVRGKFATTGDFSIGT